MVRRSFRFGLWVGLLLGVAFALRKAAERRAESLRPPADPWTPVPRPPEPVVTPQPVPDAEPISAPVFVDAPPLVEEPPAPAPVAKKAPAAKKQPAAKKSTAPASTPPKAAWVAAEEGVCPGSHPIKAKLSSRIFH